MSLSTLAALGVTRRKIDDKVLYQMVLTEKVNKLEKSIFDMKQEEAQALAAAQGGTSIVGGICSFIPVIGTGLASIFGGVGQIATAGIEANYNSKIQDLTSQEQGIKTQQEANNAQLACLREDEKNLSEKSKKDNDDIGKGAFGATA